jgi:hypothetical protein
MMTTPINEAMAVLTISQNLDLKNNKP